MGNNNQPFISLRKAIMKRSKSKNKLNEKRNIEDWSEHKRQRNLRSNLLKQSKECHLNNLNVKDVTENEQFWKTIKLFLTEKTKATNNIILTENNQAVREDETICQIANTYFANVTKRLKFRQVDESQSVENEESCFESLVKLVKVFLLSQYLKTILLKQSKNYLQTKHQYQRTYQSGLILENKGMCAL